MRTFVAGVCFGLFLSGTVYAASRTWTSDATDDSRIAEVRADTNEKRREENIIRALASPSPLPPLSMVGEQIIVNKGCSDGVKEMWQGVKHERAQELDAMFSALSPAQKCARLSGTWDASTFRCSGAN